MSGTDLRQARGTKGWNQSELAQRLGVSQGYVSRLESSRRPLPKRLLRKVVAVLGLPASDLPVTSDSEPLPPDNVARALGVGELSRRFAQALGRHVA